MSQDFAPGKLFVELRAVALLDPDFWQMGLDAAQRTLGWREQCACFETRFCESLLSMRWTLCCNTSPHPESL